MEKWFINDDEIVNLDYVKRFYRKDNEIHYELRDGEDCTFLKFEDWEDAIWVIANDLPKALRSNDFVNTFWLYIERQI